MRTVLVGLITAITIGCSGGEGDGTVDDDSSSGEGDATVDDDSAGEIPDLTVTLGHRTVGAECAGERGSPEQPSGCGPSDECSVHEDCTTGAHGVCVSEAGCVCLYDDCVVDADCGAGQVCVCADDTVYTWYPAARYKHRCVSADCAVDADCASGYCLRQRFSCGSVDEPSGYATHSYACATERDECRGDEACPSGDPCGYDDEEDRWACDHTVEATCD
jgi:hypothetical protein